MGQVVRESDMVAKVERASHLAPRARGGADPEFRELDDVGRRDATAVSDEPACVRRSPRRLDGHVDSRQLLQPFGEGRAQ